MIMEMVPRLILVVKVESLNKSSRERLITAPSHPTAVLATNSSAHMQ